MLQSIRQQFGIERSGSHRLLEDNGSIHKACSVGMSVDSLSLRFHDEYTEQFGEMGLLI